MNRLACRMAAGMLATAARLLPIHLAPWARAMERELAEIADGAAALAFAAGCLRAVLGMAIIARLESLSTWRLLTMNHISVRPRLLGLVCGAGAVGMGMAYMAAAGAPPRYLLVNLAALVLGAMAWLALGRAARSPITGGGSVILALAIPLLLTALLGVPVEGAARWVSLGPVSLQVSLIVVPAMVVLYARHPDPIGTAGILAAALALALQPDRAMAGVLLAGLLALVVATRDRLPMSAMAASIVAFCYTLLSPDDLAASPFVDRILYTAFDVHPLAGLAVLIGAAALILPAMTGAASGAGERPALLAFGGCWLGVVVAAALGNYPTPLVGYGGSAVLGYLLSVALLPSGAGEISRSGALGSRPITDHGADQTTSELRVPRLA
jgi:hypothetical protein